MIKQKIYPYFQLVDSKRDLSIFAVDRCSKNIVPEVVWFKNSERVQN